MKILFIFLFIIFQATTTFAQFGFRATYGNATADGWEKAIQDNLSQSDVHFNQLEGGVDYWFRLKNQRIEFMPTLKYASSHTEVPSQLDGVNRVFDVRSLGFQLNTHLYFLDFKGDCDCPTWSKNEPWVEKGLFVFVSPGIDYQIFQYASENTTTQSLLNVRSTGLNLNLGVGLGLDIGLSDLITLTPYAGVRFHQTVEWDGFLSEFELSEGGASSMRQIYGGFRLGIRLDD